jgi:hypothetical protein
MTEAQVIYDKQDQLDKVRSWLLDGETLYAVYDLKGVGTGFLGITDRRIIFYDRAFLGKNKATVTIPYSRIHYVSSDDDSGIIPRPGFFVTGSLRVHVGEDAFHFEFRGADKAHEAYRLIMGHILAGQ